LGCLKKVDQRRFPNAITIAKTGKLYFTDSSTKFPRSQVLYDAIESCGHGRIFSYDPESGKLELLLSGLHFPNGIQLTPEEGAFLFVETTRARIMKYHLTGAKGGQVEIFMDSCPGLPDNIKYSHQSDVYWVGLSPKLSWGDFMAPYPWLRDFIVKLIAVDTILSLVPKHGIIIAINHQGNIVKSLQDPNGNIMFLSEVVEQNGYVYIGSWKNDYIVQLNATEYLPLKK